MRKTIELALTIIVFLIYIVMLKNRAIDGDTAVFIAGFLVFIGIHDVIKEIIKSYILLGDNTKGKIDE